MVEIHKLNEAVALRVKMLLKEHNMTQYQLSILTGLPKATISNVVNASNESISFRTIYVMCQGFGITFVDFFDHPLFYNENLEP